MNLFIRNIPIRRKLASLAITALVLIISLTPLVRPRQAFSAASEKVIILTTSGTWDVPSDWNPNDNKIEAIGAGGYGGAGTFTAAGGGGGGGSYAIITNFDVAGRTQIDYTVGTSSLISGESDSVFGDNELFAEGGGIGTNTTNQVTGSGGAGGAAADNIPTINAHSGGDGAEGGTGEGGGGGAAGPDGDGSSAPDGTGVDGGGSGGGSGGTAFSSGGDGSTWQDTTTGETAGPGGGAGAGGLAGGNYGGGAGGAQSGVGIRNPGTNGVIVITYLPLGGSIDAGVSSNSSGSNPTFCGNTSPVNAPSLFQIRTTNKTAQLFFTPSRGIITGYKISYGLKDGIARFGASITAPAGKGSISFTVKSLKPNTKYFFKVLPVNGCQPGIYSNQMLVKTTARSVQKLTFHFKH